MLRRHFVVGALGTAGSVAGLRHSLAQGSQPGGSAPSAANRGAKPLPGYADWKNPDAVIVHTGNTIETRREAIGTSGITSTDSLFVRNNLPPPDASVVDDPDAWTVSIEGVGRARSVRLGDLKRLGTETVAAVLQCSGNGRGFFAHDASGTQWRTGAAGNVLWSGVPLRAVREAYGDVPSGRRFLTATGGETLPANVDPKSVIVERSIPIEAADTAILAWEMNGQPIPLAHGGPLRLVVPGFFGVNNIKYVKRLAFTETETDAAIQRTGYRLRPVDQRGAPDQPSMWAMPVKSWITHPLRDASSGQVQIHGVAFGGTDPLQRVEVSIDGGRNWREARLLGPDMGRYAWRPFVLAADLSNGNHSIASRATNGAGQVQPEDFPPNERGYGHNGWRAHAVEVTVS